MVRAEVDLDVGEFRLRLEENDHFQRRFGVLKSRGNCLLMFGTPFLDSLAISCVGKSRAISLGNSSELTPLQREIFLPAPFERRGCVLGQKRLVCRESRLCPIEKALDFGTESARW